MSTTNIAELYANGTAGWPGKEVADQAWDVVKGDSAFKKFMLSAPRGVGKLFLYDVTRKVLGKDTPNYPQQIGDCVSFGAKNANEYLQCCEILMHGDAESFRPIFAPYFYGTGRVFIGGGQLGNGDGSLGSWQAAAVVKYGALASDEPGVPAYSGTIAKAWGGPSGKSHLDKWVPTGQKHIIKSAAPIASWSQLLAAITNGYPVTIASTQGFEMNPRSDGFHYPSGEWAHQMTIIGIDDEWASPYVLVLNSWGDVHGQLVDFYDKTTKLPVGVLRVKKNVIEYMMSSGEAFAYSNFQGFPSQDLPQALFKLV